MNKVRHTLAAGAALLLMFGTSAIASEHYAGSLKDDPVVAVPAPVPIKDKSDWYLRGDIGWAWYDDPDIFESNIFAHTLEEIDPIFTIGGGVGLYFTNHLRADFTLEYRDAADVFTRNPDAWIGGDNKFTLESLVGLFNVYYDFGCRCGFTPYVGLGLGFVYHETGTRHFDVNDIHGEQFTAKGKDSTDVAAAAMVGFSKMFETGFYLDANYRFLYLGEAEAGGTYAHHQKIGELDIERIHAHEFRLGVRYDLGDSGCCGEEYVPLK